MPSVFVENKILHYNKKKFDSENLSLEILSDSFHTLEFGEKVEEIDIEFLHETLSQKYVCCVNILPNPKVTVNPKNENFYMQETSLIGPFGILYFTPRFDSETYKIPEGVLDAVDWGEYVNKRNIKKIVFPSTIFNLSYFDFSEFRSLESVEMNGNQNRYETENGWILEKGKIIFIAKKNGESVIPSSLKINDDFFQRLKYEPKDLRFSVSDDNKNYKSQNGVIYDKHGKLIFINDSEKNLVIPEGVKKIDPNFSRTAIQNLESIYLPSTLETVDFSIFSSIKKVILSEENKKLKLADSVLYTKKGDLISICNFSGNTLIIPEGVKDIGDFYSLFNNSLSKNLEEIIFPKTVFSFHWDSILSTAFLNGTKITFHPDSSYRIRTVKKESDLKSYSEYFELIDKTENKVVAKAGSKSINKFYSIVLRQDLYFIEMDKNISSEKTLFIFSGIREAAKFLKENMENILKKEYMKINEEQLGRRHKTLSMKYALQSMETLINTSLKKKPNGLSCSIKFDLSIKEIDIMDKAEKAQKLTNKKPPRDF